MKKNNRDSSEFTDFGFQRVPFQDKARRVAEVFHSVAPRYDLMNDLMSFGIHRLWKRYVLALARIQPGQRILDLAGGTGDLTAQIAKRLGGRGAVVLCDINEAMLLRGRDRLIDSGQLDTVHYVQADAETLPFPDGYFDAIVMGFGLRNVACKERALRAMHGVLKTGGQLLVLEFSHPTSSLLSLAYDVYSFRVLPRLGGCVVNDQDSYRYLAESIRRHPNQVDLLEMLRQAGFIHCDYHNLTGGIVAVHRGYK